MHRQIIFVGLLIICSLLSGCASIVKEIKVEPSEYNDIKEAEKIVVGTKDNSQHTIIKHNFTDSSLIGTELISDEVLIPFKARLSNISSVKIQGVRDNLFGEIITYEEIKRNITTNKRVSYALIGAISIGLFGIIPSAAIMVPDPYGMRENNHPALFFLCEAVFIVAGGGLGYQMGENADIKSAIKKIEQKRLKENRKIK